MIDERRLKPTELGIKLVDVYQEYAPDLISHTKRAEVEKELKKIEMGEATSEEVYNIVY